MLLFLVVLSFTMWPLLRELYYTTRTTLTQQDANNKNIERKKFQLNVQLPELSVL
jgi:hypothetical protein